MKRFKYLLTSILCVLLITSIISFTGCSFLETEEETTTSSSSNSSSGSTGGNNNNTTSTYYMNQVVTNSAGVKFMITNVQNTKQVGASSYGDSTENNFIIVTIKIENKSNASVTIDTPELIRKSNEASYESEYLLSLDNQIVIYEEISSGITKSFNVAFETPTKSTDEDYILEISYGKSSWFTNNDIKFILKNK